MAALVGAVALMVSAAVLGVYSFVQSRRRRGFKLSAGTEPDEISLISPMPSRRTEATLPK